MTNWKQEGNTVRNSFQYQQAQNGKCINQYLFLQVRQAVNHGIVARVVFLNFVSCHVFRYTFNISI